MLEFIEGQPEGVLAIEAKGTVTHDDYKFTLIPMAEAMIAKGPIKMLYVIGKDFTGFEFGAMMDDGMFGLRHWHDVTHIALVTDHAWMRTAVGMLKPFFHGDIRLFPLAELDQARAWIDTARCTEE